MIGYKILGQLALGVAGVLAMVVPQAASAQVYRCSNGGSTYLSDRPCSGVPAGKLGMVGATPDRSHDYSTASAYVPPVGKAPEHLAYMNAECASLNDAIRTGPARGLKSAAMNDLHNEYHRKCQEEESAAYRRLSQQKAAERQEKQSQQMAQQAQANEAVRNREQCSELLRILAGKRRQADAMNAGEKADLQRFEANYNARCKD